ncbi:malate dehydrogenase [Labeo rohita]|uniref:Malate dehydrogenase n=1 Tax=Labeo rohita TaxID=84645 RepID=A0ABQ8L372_LABRO|nr:malate dehydrogenase [Labeo rohita]
MDILAVLLLCLKQGHHSLDDHMRDFLHQTHYPVFKGVSPLSWKTSQPSSLCMDQLPEATADGEPELVATRELAQEPTTEPINGPEPKPLDSSDQVCQPATSPIHKEALVDIEGLVGSPAHTSATVPSPATPPSPAFSLNASLFLCLVSTGSCQSLSSEVRSDPPWAQTRHEDPLSPPPAFKPWTSPLSSDPSALPWLLALSSLSLSHWLHRAFLSFRHCLLPLSSGSPSPPHSYELSTLPSRPWVLSRLSVCLAPPGSPS